VNQVFRKALRFAIGIPSLFLTLHGVYSLYGLDLRRDRLVSLLYFVFQLTSFFVFLLVKGRRTQTFLHAVNGLGYLVTYSMLNWRQCSELNYCTSTTATVAQTAGTVPVLAAFAVFLLSACTISIYGSQGAGETAS
jgi:hypothetical protein